MFITMLGAGSRQAMLAGMWNLPAKLVISEIVYNSKLVS